MTGRPEPRTLFWKIWARHRILKAHGRALLYVDLNYVHEGSRHAFAALEADGRGVRRPAQTVAIADHYVPTTGRPEIADPTAANMIQELARNARRHGALYVGLESQYQGIVHVVGPELGLTLPGMFVTCADSHVSTHGALGALTSAIGTSELKHVLATQALWQRRPDTMRIVIDGRLGTGVGAKDMILSIIGKIGSNGAAGCVVEYAGSAICALPMDGRFTVCNMSIEMGARAGLIAPDATTFSYLKGRLFAPKDADWSAVAASWHELHSDDGAVFDRVVAFDAADVAPMVTWGTSPEESVSITGRVPDPARISQPERRSRTERALRYMGLAPGTPLTEIEIDRVFIGSCTNSRLGDLREAAAVLKGRKAVVPGLVVPGSREVKRMAEAEGLDSIFRSAGLEWRDPGCSLCVGVNGDLLAQGERCASTSNRNFEGRQGRGVRTHLMSPSMAAAAATTGRLTDVRQFGGG